MEIINESEQTIRTTSRTPKESWTMFSTGSGQYQLEIHGWLIEEAMLVGEYYTDSTGSTVCERQALTKRSYSFLARYYQACVHVLTNPSYLFSTHVQFVVCILWLRRLCRTLILCEEVPAPRCPTDTRSLVRWGRCGYRSAYNRHNGRKWHDSLAPVYKFSPDHTVRCNCNWCLHTRASKGVEV